MDELRISSSVETIGEAAFAGCRRLARVVFEPEARLAKIERNAFQGCQKLEALVLPKSLREIEEGAFCGCSSLKEITFEEGSLLEQIGQKAFADTGLTATVLPSKSVQCGEEAFPAGAVLTHIDAAELPNAQPEQPASDYDVVTLPSYLATAEGCREMDISKLE